LRIGYIRLGIGTSGGPLGKENGRLDSIKCGKFLEYMRNC